LTSEDHVLDIHFQWPLLLYRLAKAKYADLSGVGAAVFPGRWNLPGQEAIYTSTEKGVPLLERLVHTRKDLIPSKLALMTIRVEDYFFESDVDYPLDEGWFATCRTLKRARAFYDPLNGFPPSPFGQTPYAVALPSVIVPVWNVVLYPRSPGFFNHVSLESVEPFEFDPRLFPENTPIELP